MTLTDIRNMFFAPPQPADFDVYPLEYSPEVDDYVICIARDSMGKVTAIDTPYCDGLERYYVEGNGWADWLTLQEIF